ncbi:MAG: GWxTD domain-containing protein [Candidatus Krumholzibacteriia bacterium]
MAFKSCRRDRVSIIPILAALSALLLPGAAAAVLHPLDGGGNFHSYVEIVNRWRDDGRLDVLVLIEVNNADLEYEEEASGLVGRLRVEVELESLDGRIIEEKRQVRTPGLSTQDAGSRTLFQIFGVVLEDVPFRTGKVTCRIYDVNRLRTGLYNQLARKNSRSESASLWYAEESPRPERGLALGDPLFLAQAPLKSWNPDNAAKADPVSGWLHDYMHPSRRFGLQQDRLQLFLPVWPQAGGIPSGQDPPDLRVQITNLDMDFVVNDTIRIDERGRLALVAGRSAGLFYELDVNLLPEGPYRLSLAPLDGQGRGVLRDFSVVWRLANLGRHRHQVLGEGRTVFQGKELDQFLDSSPAVQEKMLDEFWDALNPDPTNPVNEVYLEFQYRLAYVRQFLGGFGEFGAADDRGELFLMLGPPDELKIERMPMNEMDQDDARIQVFNRFAPDREGSWAKGDPAEGTSEPLNPYDTVGGLPMPNSFHAERERGAKRYSATHTYAFELWIYHNGGNDLFLNRFSQRGMGQRFLFVDRTGAGDYVLESSNVMQGDE